MALAVRGGVRRAETRSKRRSALWPALCLLREVYRGPMVRAERRGRDCAFYVHRALPC